MRGRGEPDTAPRDRVDHHTRFERPARPDPRCGNCDGRGRMSCVCREVHDRCEDDCLTCCTGPYPEHLVRIWRDDTAPRGHPMAWRARCRCFDARNHFTSAWAAHSHVRAMQLANLHATDPHADDWLILTDRARERESR